MAQQIKKKFIGDNQIDGDKIRLLKDQRLESEDQAGNVVAMLQLASDSKVLVGTGDSENPLSEVGTKAQVDEEKARAMLAEQGLQEAIDDEVTARILAVSTEQNRAEDEEERIEGLVTAEVTRASGEETRIEGKVDAEKTRAEAQEGLIRQEFAAADTALHSVISQEIDDDVAAEAALRVAADTALQNQINDIISNTDAAALDSLSEIVAAFQSADSDLSQAITDALGTHTNELNAYKTSNDAALAQEVSDRIEGDNAVQGNLNAYVTSNDAALAVEATSRAEEDALMLKLDGSRSMEADLSMGVVYDFNSVGESPHSFIRDDENGLAKIIEFGFPITPEQADQITHVEYEGNLYKVSNIIFGGFGPEATIEGEFPVTGQTVFARYGSPVIASSKITRLADGVDASDAVNKGQMDAEDALMLKLDGSRSMEADLSMTKATFISYHTETNSFVFDTNKVEVYSISDPRPWQDPFNPEPTHLKINGISYEISESNDQGWAIIYTLNEPHNFLNGEPVEVEVGYFESSTFGITGLADGSADSDAVNKGQMDAALASAASDVSALQSELDATQTAAGLGEDGSYDPNQIAQFESYYIFSANSLFEADMALDAQVKVNADAISAEVTRASEEESRIEDKVDAEKARIDVLNGNSSVEGSVAKAIADVVDMAPEALNTLNELAAAIGDDANFAGTVTQMFTDLKGGVTEAFDTMKEIEDEFAKLNGDSSVVGSIDAKVAAEAQLRSDADAALSSRATTLESEMDSAEGRLDALEAVEWVSEKIVVSADQIAAGAVELAHAPIDNSLVIFVGRLAIHEVQDYTISGTTVTFAGDLAAGGTSAMVVNDEIYVKYQK